MLESVIKRDGTVEAADIDKLLRWSSWAARGFEDRANWEGIVRRCLRVRDTVMSTKALQNRLKKLCVRQKRWAYQIMAGRLEIADLRKELYDNKIPSIHMQYIRMHGMGLVEEMPYTPEEFEQLEAVIDHAQDETLAYYQVRQLARKYSIQLENTGQIFETPQFIFMRMAMALAMREKREKWVESAAMFYRNFSGASLRAQKPRVSNPTPNYLNLGTGHRGYASCCLIAAGDDAESIGIAVHIAYTMTYMSCGIGTNFDTRSIADPVRGGKIVHNGKGPYLEYAAKAVKANTQGGRGGAQTTHITCYDPEIMTMLRMQNPRTPASKRNRDLHLTTKWNAFFAEAVMADREIFLFNVFTAPDLHEAIDTASLEDFTAIYNRYEADESFTKKYVKARDVAYLYMQQRKEVSTNYDLQIDYANHHTPHNDRIRSSNLCTEILQPTEPYYDMQDLYLTDHRRGEVSMCSLAGVPINNIDDDDNEGYFEACYVALKTIDNAIHQANYKFPHIKYTATSRMNAGVGILGLATWLARKGLRYDTPEGLAAIDWAYQRHMYFLIEASLKLGQELGNAPWMNRTKWPQGWLPIDTYNRNIDEIVPLKLYWDWEDLRARVIANGGIRNSSLATHMPTESSSKAVAAPNCAYPVRDLTLAKTDLKNAIDWCAPDNDILEDQYQIAYDIAPIDMIKVYGVIGKWTDQTISADTYDNRKVKPKLGKRELILEFIARYKYGVKSSYYNNSYLEAPDQLTDLDEGEEGEDLQDEVREGAGAVCTSGGCTL